MATLSSAMGPMASGSEEGFAHDRELVDVSPDVVRDLHTDAVLLKRGELLVALPWLAIALAAVAVAFALHMWPILILSGAVIVHIGQLTWQWWRVRRTDPTEYFVRERQEDVSVSNDLAVHNARSSATKPVVTRSLMALIGIVTAVQFATGVSRSVERVALVKSAALAGEWWRLLTASFLHANLLHVLGNLAALFLLGSLIETYDRRMRVPLIFLASVLGGSVASVALIAGSGLGASGGVLGLAGYLLIVTYRAPGLLPAAIQRKVQMLLVSTALYGLIGFFFIDNAAHAGGTLAGVLVGVLASRSRTRRSSDAASRVWDRAGWAASAILLAGAVFTIVRLID